MNFTKVPRQIQKQIQKLTEDEVFQERFGKDQILDQLDQLKYDSFLQYNQLQLFRQRRLLFDNLYLNNITLSLWSFLYIIKSPLIYTEEKITTVDIDLFFYLLQTKKYDCNMQSVITNSMNYCQNTLHINYQKAGKILQKIIKIHFRVLNMFPKLKTEGNKPVFNVDWLSSIASKVCQVSNYNIRQVYDQISVCQAYYLFAQYCRQKGSESIYLRTDQEIMQEQDQRATILVVERLIELKVLEEKEKLYYINLIHDQEVNNG